MIFWYSVYIEAHNILWIIHWPFWWRFDELVFMYMDAVVHTIWYALYIYGSRGIYPELKMIMIYTDFASALYIIIHTTLAIHCACHIHDFTLDLLLRVFFCECGRMPQSHSFIYTTILLSSVHINISLFYTLHFYIIVDFNLLCSYCHGFFVLLLIYLFSEWIQMDEHTNEITNNIWISCHA